MNNTKPLNHLIRLPDNNFVRATEIKSVHCKSLTSSTVVIVCFEEKPAYLDNPQVFPMKSLNEGKATAEDIVKQINYLWL